MSDFRALAREINEAFPLGSFDDDPGGPWIGPHDPCVCAKGIHPGYDVTAGRAPLIDCQRKDCPHRLDRRPGWRSG